MNKYAMIKDNRIENVVIWDGISEWDHTGYTVLDITGIQCGPGWTLENGEFLPPVIPEIIPEEE